MAPQDIRSATYCGEMGSKNSVPIGSPISEISLRIDLANIKPLLASKVLFRSGSLIRPFQPTVVLGFSKYTLITIKRLSEN